MNLSAISMGYAVPETDFNASVHSVFQSALNLRLQEEWKLLTLIASDEGDLPQGIRVHTPDGILFEGFQAGQQAICRDGLLRFETSSLIVKLKGARRWKCDLPALKFDPRDPEIAARWTYVWQVLNERQRRMGAEIVAEDVLRSSQSVQGGVPGRVKEAMRDLLDATRRYELTGDAAVRSLIGLGSGLTPSGDDLLAGYMAGLWSAMGDASERTRFISGLGKMIIGLSQHTNDISRTYLYHAAQGQVSSRLADLTEGICRGNASEHLHRMAEAAMELGHTSGMDVVTGLLMGLAAWEGAHLFSM